jgi:hypothetical protein
VSVTTVPGVYPPLGQPPELVGFLETEPLPTGLTLVVSVSQVGVGVGVGVGVSVGVGMGGKSTSANFSIWKFGYRTTGVP